MATGVMTLQQMLRLPYVLGVYSKVNPAGLMFQQAMKIGPTDPATERVQGINRHVVYDIFSSSRVNAQIRPPMVGPNRVAPKVVGQSSATLMRMYESIEFPFEKVYDTRQLGGQWGGALDSQGERWVSNQLLYAAQRYSNMVEFMISRMFRGGFSVTVTGDQWRLGELSASGYTYNVTYPIPSTNLTNINGIIDANWNVSSTKIFNHMLLINQYSQLLTGYEITDCFMSSGTFIQMAANTQLNTIRGTANRVFEDYAAQLVKTSQEARNIGFTVKFPSMPQFNWHIYDGTSAVNSSTGISADADPATHTSTNNSLYIPDGKVLMTPALIPGDWYGSATCEEVIREQGEWSPPVRKQGFSAWRRPINSPPGEALDQLLNYVPLAYNPSAWFYATVY